LNPCKVYIFNPETERYETVFEPDRDFVKKSREYINSGGKIVPDMGKDQVFYLNFEYQKNENITLRYEIEQSDYDEMSAFLIPDIPKISMEYE